jgi:deoxycytidine triphosphate deaminase
VILAKSLNERGVVISPQDNSSKEQVSVDLAVGDLFQKSGSVEWRSIKEKITINPGHCVLIQTKENISMPNNVFGLLATKGNIGAKGLIIANTKLDPLFRGKLNIPVYNVSNKKIELKQDQKYCSISFWVTKHAVTGTKTRSAVKIQPSDTSPIYDFFSNNAPT